MKKEIEVTIEKDNRDIEAIKKDIFETEDSKELIGLLYALMEEKEFDLIDECCKKRAELLEGESLADYIVFSLVYLNFRQAPEEKITETIEHFRSMPYRSQEIEEILNNLYQINENIKSSILVNPKDENNIKEVMNNLTYGSNDVVFENVLTLINLYEAEGVDFSKKIVKILHDRDDYDEGYFYMLIYLFCTKNNDEIVFYKDGVEQRIVPSKYSEVYEKYLTRILNCNQTIIDNTKNVSVTSGIMVYAIMLLSELFPDRFDNIDIESMCASIFKFMCEQFAYDYELDPAYIKLEKNEDEIAKFDNMIAFLFKEDVPIDPSRLA